MISNPTSIEFIIIPFFIKGYKVQLIKAKIVHDFSESYTINIPKEIFKYESYLEAFDIINDQNKYIHTFQMPIYEGIMNHIYYDVLSKTLTSFELIFFSKNPYILPTTLNYNELVLDKFDNNGNRNRKRICLVNVDPAKIEYIKSDIIAKDKYSFSKESYQIIIRLADNNSIKYSITNFKTRINYKGNFLDKNILTKNDFFDETNNFCSCYSSFLNKLNQVKPKDITKGTLESFSKELDSLNQKYKEIENKEEFEYLSNPLNYEINKTSLEYAYQNLFISEYNSIYKKDKKENGITNFFNFAKFAAETHDIQSTFFAKLVKDKNLDDSEKVKLLEACSDICKRIILSNNSIFDLDYVNIAELAKTDKENPYYRAVELVNNIIDNLDENSRLFEVFLYFNSGTIENYLEKNEKIEYYSKNMFEERKKIKTGTYKTEFGLSLLNINQVKSHLKTLIPKIIIRLETNVKFRAYFENETNIMIMNEKSMFNEKCKFLDIKFKEKDAEKFIIPIAVEILHELMSHGKLRLYNEEEESPRYYRDSMKNFEYNSILKKCEIEDKNYKILPVPESGRILEKFISENEQVINFLKSPSLHNLEFLDYKYWIGPNFNDLQNRILQCNKNENIEGKPALNDELDDYEIDDCGFVNKKKKLKSFIYI